MTIRHFPGAEELTGSVHNQPVILIILPFEPKMSLISELDQQLKNAADKVQRGLQRNYPEDISHIMMQKLNMIIKSLNYNTYKKSIAIYLSPVFEKVLYLDMPVVEKMIIDESIDIRELVYAKKELHEFLVLLIGSDQSMVYLGNTDGIKKIQSSHASWINEIKQKPSNFLERTFRRGALPGKFLYHIDDEFSLLLQAFPLPVFIMGSGKIIDNFKTWTKNKKSILGYISGDFDFSSEKELADILKFYTGNWEKVKEKYLQYKIEWAAGENKLSTGIREVWKQVSRRRGRLLIVEKNYRCMSIDGNRQETNSRETGPGYKFYIRDRVDEIIEKILEEGGDVEFMEENLLKKYGRIALVEYYESILEKKDKPTDLNILKNPL